MRAYERQLLADLDAALDALRARGSKRADDVRIDLAAGLQLIVAASFEQRREDYAADVAAMNIAWDDDVHRQSPAIPPKYFGGDPMAITPRAYILHVSLNHRLLDDLAYPEYVALRDPALHYATCAGFFAGPHYYTRSRFFTARVTAHRAWAGESDAWRGLRGPEVLHRRALFLERYPTWSVKSVPPPRRVPEVYCGAINDRTRAFVLAIAPPATILLAGNEGAQALNEHRVLVGGAPRAWDEARIPKNPPAQRAAVFHVGRNQLALGAENLTVVRCGFVPSASGINSRHELSLLGRLLAGDPFDPSWTTSASAD